MHIDALQLTAVLIRFRTALRRSYQQEKSAATYFNIQIYPFSDLKCIQDIHLFSMCVLWDSTQINALSVELHFYFCQREEGRVFQLSE